MIKKIMTWVVAIVAMVSLSAVSAYLAYEASPMPIILSETIEVEKPVEVVVTKTVEVPVEVEHEYDGHMYVAVFEATPLPDGTRRFSARTVPSAVLPNGALYMVQVDYDIDRNIPFVYFEIGLYMPDMALEDYQILPVLIENATNVRVTYVAGWDMPELGEDEDEF